METGSKVSDSEPAVIQLEYVVLLWVYPTNSGLAGIPIKEELLPVDQVI